jgi:O-antigen/teichoic acid export membrane protein
MPGLRKITANSVTWFIGQIATKFSGLVLVIVAARMMGEAQFGKYTVVMAYYVIFNVIIDFGLRPLIIREVARDPLIANKYLTGASLIKVAIHLLCLVVVIPLLRITHTPPDTFRATVFAVIALLPFALSQTFSSFYMALERMYYEALIVGIGQVLWMVVVIAMLVLGYDLVALFQALIALNMAILLMNLGVFATRFFRPRIEYDYKVIRAMAMEAIPFAMTSAFAILYFRVDTLMLSWMKGDVEVSWYGLAYRVTDAVNFVPIALMVSVYPIVSRLFVSNRDTMKILVEKCYYYLFVLGLPISAGLALVSRKLISLISSNQYGPSMVALALLSWTLLPLFLNSVLITAMNSANQQRRVTRATLISLLVNVVGNALLIPFSGFYGACLTTILSEVVILIIIKRELTRTYGFNFPPLKNFIRPLLATLLMVIVGVVLSEINVFLLIVLSAAVYCLALLALKGVHQRDLALFQQALLEKDMTVHALDYHRQL